MKIVAKPDTFARARILKGYSQRELAKRAGLSHAYVSMLERSMKSIGPAAAKRLSEALEVPMETLFTIS